MKPSARHGLHHKICCILRFLFIELDAVLQLVNLFVLSFDRPLKVPELGIRREFLAAAFRPQSLRSFQSLLLFSRVHTPSVAVRMKLQPDRDEAAERPGWPGPGCSQPSHAITRDYAESAILSRIWGRHMRTAPRNPGWPYAEVLRRDADAARAGGNRHRPSVLVVPGLGNADGLVALLCYC